MPGVPGGLERSRVLARSGKGKLRALECTVFLGNVHLVLRTMLAEAVASLKLKGIDSFGPIRVRAKTERELETGPKLNLKRNGRESGGSSGRDLARSIENTLLAKMLRDAVNDLV